VEACRGAVSCQRRKVHVDDLLMAIALHEFAISIGTTIIISIQK
jgi:hypothetical protein